MVSSRGVADAPIVESCRPTLEKPRAYLRNIPEDAGGGSGSGGIKRWSFFLGGLFFYRQSKSTRAKQQPLERITERPSNKLLLGSIVSSAALFKFISATFCR